MWFGPCGGWMWIGWPMVLVVGLVLWLIYGHKAKHERGETSEEILKRRYARGEIDHDTYQRMLDEIRN